jgi:hypothetical protein
MIGKELVIDINNKKSYPKVVWKENTDSHLVLHLEFKDSSAYRAVVEKITTNGKYYVKIIEKI